MRIVIVDDTTEDLLLARRILLQAKVLNDILVCGSGQGCIQHIEKVLRDSQEDKPEPCLMFLDLIMTPVSGLDVLRFLQNSRYRKYCAVVMISGLHDIKAIHEGYLIGAKTFLLKPLGVRDLIEVLNSLQSSISIERTGGGYLLHWKEGITASDQPENTSQMALPFQESATNG